MVIYNIVVMDCFFNALHAGSLENRDNHFRVESIHQICLYAAMDKERQRVEKARFRASGNPFIIAGLEWICRQLEGQEKPLIPLEKDIIMDVLQIPATRHPDALLLIGLYNQLIKRINDE